MSISIRSKKQIIFGAIIMAAGICVILVSALTSPRSAQEVKAETPRVQAKEGVADKQTPKTQTENLAPPETASSGSSVGTATQDLFMDGREVESGDPLVKKYVDEKGQLVREIRNNVSGLPLTDTRFAEGQKTTVEKSYAEDGTLLRVRRYQNSRLVDTQVLR